MKKIGFFILFLPVLRGFGSKVNSVDPPYDLRVFKTAQVTHNVNDLDHDQVLILLLITLIFVLLFGILMYHVVRRLIRIGCAYRLFISNRWVEDPDFRWRKADETDLNLGTFTEQQWLLSQLFLQDHEGEDAQDLINISHDLWS